MTKRILFVEDNALIRDSFSQLLKTHGYEVILAENGREALEILNDNPEDLPCLIITDLMMPEMDGRQLIKLLRQDDCLVSLPVVLQTMHEKPDLPDEVRYVKKALDVDKVLDYVKEFCGPADQDVPEGQTDSAAACDDSSTLSLS